MTPSVIDGYEPRPFGHWINEAQDLGFNMLTHHDKRSFEVWIRLEPRTRKARTAVDMMLGDHHPNNAIEVKTVYDKASAEIRASGIEPPPRDDLASALALGFDDAAAEAVRMAREALDRLEAARG